MFSYSRPSLTPIQAARALSRVSCAVQKTLLVIHFKHSVEYVSIPNSLTILSPLLSPPHLSNHKLLSEVLGVCLWVKFIGIVSLDSTYKGCRMIFMLSCLNTVLYFAFFSWEHVIVGSILVHVD